MWAAASLPMCRKARTSTSIRRRSTAKSGCRRGGRGVVQARILLLKNIRQHVMERDYDYKRFHVETQHQEEKAAQAKP